LKPVVIAGAGLSGLSAGVRLAAHNIPVLVLEQRPAAGGRAYSFVDARTGDVIDNGQHVLIAGYVRTLGFLRTIGTADRLTVQPVPELWFHHPQRGFCSIRFSGLPHPLDLVSGLLRTSLLSAGGKVHMLRAGAALNAFNSQTEEQLAGMTVAGWLDHLHQSEETRRSFWEPLAVAIMNEHIDVAAASVFVRAIHAAFFEVKGGAALALPTVGLSALYVEGAQRFIEKRAGEVRCNSQVVNLKTGKEHVTGVTLKDGTSIEASAVVLAVPPSAADLLLPAALREAGMLTEIAAAPHSPIVSVHLWFPKEIMPHLFLGIVGRTIQWVFNRRRILTEKGTGGHVSVVVSAGDAIVGLDNEALRDTAMNDLKEIFGHGIPEPEHVVIIREKRATISCTPAVEKLRPYVSTPIRNLFLAGDWTATGLPATIESAIISGERAADLALAGLHVNK
jgi:squalene-associated FAD-dependent desaturase